VAARHAAARPGPPEPAVPDWEAGPPGAPDATSRRSASRGEHLGEAIAAARGQGVHPGYALKRDYEGMEDALLVCVTERRTPADIDRLAEALAG